MTRPPNPKAKHQTLIVRANDECDSMVIKYFKEVCARDGLEYRKEILSLIENEWKNKHRPPGNPQKQLVQFDGSKKSRGLCEVEGCPNRAEYLCYSAFPFGEDRRLCNRHRVDEERRNNVRESVKLKS